MPETSCSISNPQSMPKEQSLMLTVSVTRYYLMLLVKALIWIWLLISNLEIWNLHNNPLVLEIIILDIEVSLPNHAYIYIINLHCIVISVIETLVHGSRNVLGLKDRGRAGGWGIITMKELKIAMGSQYLWQYFIFDSLYKLLKDATEVRRTSLILLPTISVQEKPQKKHCCKCKICAGLCGPHWTWSRTSPHRKGVQVNYPIIFYRTNSKLSTLCKSRLSNLASTSLYSKLPVDSG